MSGHIDVLLACYHGEEWLPAQLVSLMAQDDRDFSVLLQDDAGEPAGIAAQALSQHSGRFRKGAHNGCHFGARGNFWDLLRQSDAPYVAFCDQDDVWLPNRLSACRAVMEEAEAQYGAGTPLLVHSDARLIDAQGEVLAESFFAHQGWDPKATGLPRLLVQNNVTGCTVLINRALADLALETGDPDKFFMHDWYLALTAAAFGRVFFLPLPLVNYRQHGSNVQGASRRTLWGRGLAALRLPGKARARIRLSYRHAQMFRDACGDRLPRRSRAVIEAYLATERRPWPLRVWQVRRLGCTMQSRITRAGQIFFG